MSTEALVVKYLEKNYEYKLKTLMTCDLHEKGNASPVTLAEVREDLKVMFILTDDEFFTMFDKWAEKEYVKLNNIREDFKLHYFKEFGVEPNNSDRDALNEYLRNHVHNCVHEK